MAAEHKDNDFIRLAQLLKLWDLPTLPELVLDGVHPQPDLYRKVVYRLAANYAGSAHLNLAPLEDDRFQVLPQVDWEDSAYWLGNLANLRENRVVINAPEDLLTWGLPPGAPPHADLSQAVLANLELLSAAPQGFGLGTPRQALTKALQDALQVVAARQAA